MQQPENITPQTEIKKPEVEESQNLQFVLTFKQRRG